MMAGRLRHRIEVQIPSDPASDDTGNPDISYTTAGKIWASIDPLSVTERLRAEQVSATATHMVVIRHLKLLEREDRQKFRFLFGTRVFAVESILPTEMRPIEMKILVREEVGA